MPSDKTTHKYPSWSQGFLATAELNGIIIILTTIMIIITMITITIIIMV